MIQQKELGYLIYSKKNNLNLNMVRNNKFSKNMKNLKFKIMKSNLKLLKSQMEV